MDIQTYPMRVIKLKQENLTLQENQILGFIEKTVTPFGNSAKVDCPKQYIGKRAYLIICKE
jgi:putative transposon-encoded protein